MDPPIYYFYLPVGLRRKDGPTFLVYFVKVKVRDRKHRIIIRNDVRLERSGNRGEQGKRVGEPV